MSNSTSLPKRALLTLLLILAGNATADSLPIYYIEKPPYYFTEQGTAKGFLLYLSQAIVAQAGITADFQPLPAKRILLKLEQEPRAACSIGWFKTEPRETFAWFSAPIHRDNPMQVLSSNSMLQQIRSYPSLSALLASNLRLGLVDGISYGELDVQLRQARSEKITAMPTQIVRMLAAERIDYTLIDAQELPYIQAQADTPRDELVATSFADLPSGQLRYLMCSKSIGKEMENRLNQAITALGIHP